MYPEISLAVNFLAKLLKTRISESDIDKFKSNLTRELASHYTSHWFPENPNLGSGYRCLRSVNGKMDPIVQRVVGKCNLQIKGVLPPNISIWVDPSDVSVRIGEDGSIFPVPDASSGIDNLSNRFGVA